MPVKDETMANGTGNGKLRFDPEDPEYIKDLQRPAVIKVASFVFFEIF